MVLLLFADVRANQSRVDNGGRDNRRNGSTRSPTAAPATTAPAVKFPTGPITKIVSYNTAEPSILFGRIVAQSPRENTRTADQMWFNKPGAGDLIGTNELVNAKPDGYTVANISRANFLWAQPPAIST